MSSPTSGWNGVTVDLVAAVAWRLPFSDRRNARLLNKAWRAGFDSSVRVLHVSGTDYGKGVLPAALKRFPRLERLVFDSDVASRAHWVPRTLRLLTPSVRRFAVTVPLCSLQQKLSALVQLPASVALSLNVDQANSLRDLQDLTSLRSLLQSLCWNNQPVSRPGEDQLPAGTSLAQLTALSDLGLCYLDSAEVGALADSKALASLTQLTALKLTASAITDRQAVSLLACVPSLVHLDLVAADLTGASLDAIARLQHLSSVSLKFPKLASDAQHHATPRQLAALAGLTNLRKLSLGGDFTCCVAALQHLTGVTELQVASWGEAVWAAALHQGPLKALRRLTCMWSNHVPAMPGLTCLEMHMASTTPVFLGQNLVPDFDALAESAPNLEDLTLRAAGRLTLSSINTLTALQHLTSLDCLNFTNWLPTWPASSSAGPAAAGSIDAESLQLLRASLHQFLTNPGASVDVSEQDLQVWAQSLVGHLTRLRRLHLNRGRNGRNLL